MESIVKTESNQNSKQKIAAPTYSKIKSRLVVGVLFLLVLGLAGTTFYFYKKTATATEKAAQAEVKSLVNKVGKLVVLPADETPTLATVADPEALKDQTFFVGAQQGDKVLIYTNAKKAILYSVSLNKVITIAPLNVGENPKTQIEKPIDPVKAEDKNN